MEQERLINYLPLLLIGLGTAACTGGFGQEEIPTQTPISDPDDNPLPPDGTPTSPGIQAGEVSGGETIEMPIQTLVDNDEDLVASIYDIDDNNPLVGMQCSAEVHSEGRTYQNGNPNLPIDLHELVIDCPGNQDWELQFQQFVGAQPRNNWFTAEIGGPDHDRSDIFLWDSPSHLDYNCATLALDRTFPNLPLPITEQGGLGGILTTNNTYELLDMLIGDPDAGLERGAGLGYLKEDGYIDGLEFDRLVEEGNVDQIYDLIDSDDLIFIVTRDVGNFDTSEDGYHMAVPALYPNTGQETFYQKFSIESPTGYGGPEAIKNHYDNTGKDIVGFYIIQPTAQFSTP
ncbi:hypothetical protein GF362_04230 [Candidatus Dojkabacteria bacterium]|nr:hypothetical protein [Candidatus Dojkabacteria bacterium]